MDVILGKSYDTPVSVNPYYHLGLLYLFSTRLLNDLYTNFANKFKIKGYEHDIRIYFFLDRLVMWIKWS